MTMDDACSTMSPGEDRSPSDGVLFVDDDPSVRSSIRRCLERANIPCQIAASGEDALRTLAEQPLRFSTIVADYQMPGLDGIAVLQRAAVTVPWATRILVSGQLDLNNALLAANSGAVFQIIAKPLQPLRLLDVVQRAMDRANVRQRNARLLGELRQKNAALTEQNGQLARAMALRTRELMRLLGFVLDLQQGATSDRCRRLAAYADRLGRQMGLGPDALATLEHGALVHAAIDTATPSPSTDHPPGLSLLDALGRVPWLAASVAIVRHQRERFDGTGAPDGLRGEEIPIGARILHVVTVADDLTQIRDELPARGWAWARQEVHRRSGRALAPDVVRAFDEIGDDEWHQIQADVSRGRA